LERVQQQLVAILVYPSIPIPREMVGCLKKIPNLESLSPPLQSIMKKKKIDKNRKKKVMLRYGKKYGNNFPTLTFSI